MGRVLLGGNVARSAVRAALRAPTDKPERSAMHWLRASNDFIHQAWCANASEFVTACTLDRPIESLHLRVDGLLKTRAERVVVDLVAHVMLLR